MKERKGRVAVANLGAFSHKILSMGGFLKVIEAYPTVDAGLAAVRATAVEIGSAAATERHSSGSSFSFTGKKDAGATLRHAGSLRAVYSGPFSAEDIAAAPVRADEYMVGIGAAGPDRETAASLAGEMLGIRGTIFSMPADGHLTPDFFLPEHLDNDHVILASAYRAGFSGPFPVTLTVKADSTGGTTLLDIVRESAGYLAENNPGYTGVFAFVIRGSIRGICSADIKSSILEAHRLNKAKETKKPAISSHSMYNLLPAAFIPDSATAVRVDPGYDGDTLIAFGYAVDISRAEASADSGAIEPLYYKKSVSPDASHFIYATGAIFKNAPFVRAETLEEGISAVIGKAEFTALHHLLPISKLRGATVGIAPITRIERTG